MMREISRREGVNFTKILQAAFTCADPKSAKKMFKLSSFIVLLEYVRIKAARRTLVKLTQGGGNLARQFFTLTFLGRFPSQRCIMNRESYWFLGS